MDSEAGKKYQTIDAYHADVPEPVRSKLEQLRAAIRAAAPKAKEVISYSMPAFRGHGILVYYAPWKQHIGLYPASPLKPFEAELKAYTRTKGSIHFPLDQPLPLDLITRIVQFRVGEDEEKYLAKKKK